MTEEEILEYSKIYKKHQKRLSFIIMIIIIAMGIILIGLGLFIAIYFKETFMIVAGIIMAILGGFDIPLITFLSALYGLSNIIRLSGLKYTFTNQKLEPDAQEREWLSVKFKDE